MIEIPKSHINVAKVPAEKRLLGWFNWEDKIMFVCGECGDILHLDHGISARGQVHPSLVCDCGFHEFGYLLDYDCGEKNPQQLRCRQKIDDSFNYGANRLDRGWFEVLED